MSFNAQRFYPQIFLLTGFLGSGKTSLILDHIRDPGTANTGVIVNEVGQIDVDGALITTGRTGFPVATLDNGCVCCSLNSDLPNAILELLAEREAAGGQPFERIIIETSGVSKPSPILRSLLNTGMPLRTTVLSTYDCEQGPDMTARFEEAVAQLAAAQTIVVSKVDRADDLASSRASQAAAYLNPLAAIVNERDRTQRARLAFAGIQMPLRSSFSIVARQEPNNSKHTRMNVFLIKFEEPKWDQLSEWIENLVGYCGDRLLRTKGFVRTEGRRVLIQGVGGSFDPPREIADGLEREDGLVIITRDLAREDFSTIEPPLKLQVHGL
ncbi:cobalamin biosynthesis protein CobW [Mesorhizobium sanjuanii]|uniref:Cobalamin biosynthesis protein CobW n=1 Tax=Mesorhizobium sanjuanii TaxID=2037900 RepID=A0A2A6FKV5_9HYPH|nr:GTP-binding protein [Mesorhizobium sanjuanii]PDQ22579.1 cobalamin biosynthesis protein CobW [Mesorhizobium sanjuanii]